MRCFRIWFLFFQSIRAENSVADLLDMGDLTSNRYKARGKNDGSMIVEGLKKKAVAWNLIEDMIKKVDVNNPDSFPPHFPADKFSKNEEGLNEWVDKMTNEDDHFVTRHLQSKMAHRLFEKNTVNTAKKEWEELDFKKKYMESQDHHLNEEDQKNWDILRKQYKPTATERIANLGKSIGESIDSVHKEATAAARKASDAASRGLTAVGKAGQRVGDSIASGVRTAGGKIVSGGKTVAGQTVAGAKYAGGKVAEGARYAGGKIAGGASAAYSATSSALTKAKNKARDKIDSFKENLKARSKYYKAMDPNNETGRWAMAQNQNNKEQLAQAAQQAVEAAMEMQNKMNTKRDEFGNVIKQQAQQYQQETEGTLKKLQAPIKGMNMIMEPSGGIVNGDFIQYSGWEEDAIEETQPAHWAQPGSPSPAVVSQSNQLDDMLLKECYRGIAAGNKKQIDKNCMVADIAAWRCQSPIDASFYLGVTYDLKQGTKNGRPTPLGFKGKLVKHWCRERNTYKGQFDIPDGMHIQGVYDTNIETRVSTDQSQFFHAVSGGDTSLSGEAVFEQDSSQETEVDASATGVDAGVNGQAQSGSGTVSGNANAKASANSGSTNNEGSFSKSKNNEKTSEINKNLQQGKLRDEKVYAEMTMKIVRYELFMREISPKWIHEDFLDCFMMLPTSYYAPKAPEKFQDFIDRYGTHYVHGGQFGAILAIFKEKKLSDNTVVNDVKAEAQEEMEMIVGEAANKHKAKEMSFGAGASGGGGAGGNSVSGGASFGVSAGFSDQSNSQEGTVEKTAEQIASEELKRNAFRRSSTSTTVTAIGGSHKIATTIADMYSTNFRTNLINWLDSVPYFPQMIDYKFLPLTDLMKHLLDDLIDGTCYQSCIVDKEDHCVKSRKLKIPCDSEWIHGEGRSNQKCLAACNEQGGSSINDITEDGPVVKECEVDSPRLINCYEIVDMKAKMKRRIDALRTATQLYLQLGDLKPKQHYTIDAGEDRTCTTGYDVVVNDDLITYEALLHVGHVWNDIAANVMEIQLNMQGDYFKLGDASIIGQNERFYVLFNENDRRWYTFSSLDEQIIPEFASPPVPFVDLKTVESTRFGVTVRIPVTVQVGDEEFGMIKTKHGLWLEVNMRNGGVYFNQRCLHGMYKSTDKKVQKFVKDFKDTLVSLSAGHGQTVGFMNPIIEDENKTPMPCQAYFNENQMFDLTDDLQQCVKVTVSTIEEYFVVFAASEEDKSSWIYLHQTQDSLCLHKLDRTFTKDEIGTCAGKYKKMMTGTLDSMAEQLYFCMYKKNNLLSLSVLRPSFNRNDRESAITILSHNLIQDSRVGGQNIMPRYYAVGAGKSAVHVKSTFITEIDSLECRDPFVKKTFGGSFRCVLVCHEECSDYGCIQPHDPTKCYTCKNSKLIISRPDEEDVSLCVPTCTSAGTYTIDYSIPVQTITTEIIRNSDQDLKDIDDPNQVVCVNCHPQCLRLCTGRTDEDCTQENGVRCKNFERRYTDDDGNDIRQCVQSCPVGTYVVEDDTNPDNVRYFCETCAAGCARCDGGIDTKSYDVCPNGVQDTDPTSATYCPHDVVPMCLACEDDYVEVIIDGLYVACIDNSNSDVECPDGFERNGATSCHRTWRQIGYHKFSNGPLNNPICTSASCTYNEGGNFFDLEDETLFEKYKMTDSTGAQYFSLQLAWRVDSCTVQVLEWNQNFNPLTAQFSGTKTVEILDFKQLKCIVSDPNLANLKKVSFANRNFFINCPEGQVTRENSDHLGTDETITDGKFKGLTIAGSLNTILNAGLQTNTLYNFGFKTLTTEGIEAAFEVDDEIFFTDEMSLSVHDTRDLPVGWSSWDPKIGSVLGALCVMDCTTRLQTVTRNRFCVCLPTGETNLICDESGCTTGTYDALFDQKCQPCGAVSERQTVDECELDTCTTDDPITTSTVDYTHHGCCDKSTAIKIRGLNEDGNGLGLNGVYELIYEAYDANVATHRYELLKTATDPRTQTITIEQQFTDVTDPSSYSNWIIKVAGQTYISSGYTSSGTPSKAPCPNGAGSWIIEDISQAPTLSTVMPLQLNTVYQRLSNSDVAPISVSCSSDRSKCPDLHPYSFNSGQKCCSSPFNHNGVMSGSATLLKPSDTCNTANTDCRAGESDGVTGCLGESVDCPDTTNPCRSNLDGNNDGTLATKQVFRGTSADTYNYDRVKMCSFGTGSDTCYEVVWTSDGPLAT